MATCPTCAGPAPVYCPSCGIQDSPDQLSDAEEAVIGSGSHWHLGSNGPPMPASVSGSDQGQVSSSGRQPDGNWNHDYWGNSLDASDEGLEWAERQATEATTEFWAARDARAGEREVRVRQAIAQRAAERHEAILERRERNEGLL
jgi:hypothetical protein